MSAWGALGAIGGGLIGGIGSIIAANKQAEAERAAIAEQKQEAQNSLDFQKQVYGDTKTNQAPYIQAGQGAVTRLSDLLSPGGALTQQWTGNFTAPTEQQAEQTPGYQFTFDQGLQALDRGAASRGNLLTGGQQEEEQKFGQGLASTNYQNTFNNALTQYQNAYNQFQQGQANTYNRNAGLAGVGQTAVNQLNSTSQAAAGNVAGINNVSGQLQGQYQQNLGAANASGYAGLANNIGSSLNNVGQYYQLQNLLKNTTSNI